MIHSLVVEQFDNQLRTRMNAEQSHDLSQVIVNSVATQPESTSNFLLWQTSGYQIENSLL